MSEPPDRVAMVSDLNALEKRFDERLRTLSEDIRRYFHMVAEQMRDDVKGLADGTAHHTMVFDDHEARLKRLEKAR
jgi:hypothetical protein